MVVKEVPLAGPRNRLFFFFFKVKFTFGKLNLVRAFKDV